MTKLLFGTTSLMVKVITEIYFNNKFYLYFADNFNAWPTNPPSSNPFQIYKDYEEIVRTNDCKNPKYITHRNGLRIAIMKKYSKGTKERKEGLKSVTIMSPLEMQPYLAILVWDIYSKNHPSHTLNNWPIRILPSKAASPSSIEYLAEEVDAKNDSLNLQKLYF